MRRRLRTLLFALSFAWLLPACGFGHTALGTFSSDDDDFASELWLLLLADAPRITQIVAGALHTCALHSSGVMRCWGSSDYGQLGYGNTNRIGDDETPASAGDVDTGGRVVQIAAGFFSTCALLQSGDVRCWGRLINLGPGAAAHMGDNETPGSQPVVNIGGTVTRIVAGGEHFCALLSNGAVRCWGGGTDGALGYGNTDRIGDDESPASAGDVNIGGAVLELEAGTNHNCALLNGGAVRCWGSGLGGRLGYGNTQTIGDDETPASAGDVNVGGAVARIEGGHFHTCAQLTGGALRCWGYGFNGRLGYASTLDIGDDEIPASAGDVNLGGAVASYSVGIHHTCALVSGGGLRCWGWGADGRPGYGNTNDIGDNETPASAGDVDLGGSAVQIATGQGHTCALLTTGAVRCWGRSDVGQLGQVSTATIGDDETPATARDTIVF